MSKMYMIDLFYNAIAYFKNAARILELKAASCQSGFFH